MKAFRLALAAALVTGGMGSAHATYMPWQEGVSFPDFDDPAAQPSYNLDSSRYYDWAGGFEGNVGKPGDNSDTINVVWSALAAHETITARFQVSGRLEDGTSFSAGQGLQLAMLDVQTNTTIRTINLGAGNAAYLDPSFVFDNRPYRMIVTPVGLGATESASYSISFVLTPVPEPASVALLSAGLALVALRRSRQTR